MPRRSEMEPLRERLTWARDAARETVRWAASFEFPERGSGLHVRRPSAWRTNIRSMRAESSRIEGCDIAAPEYEEHFEEMQVERSTALHSRLRGGSSLPGRSARALQLEFRSPLADGPRGRARSRARTNLYAILTGASSVRAVEVLYACDEALRIIDGL